MARNIIPVVDIFAGPGGLGEGFSAYSKSGTPVFRIARSFEKDPFAHATLRFRALCRDLRGTRRALREQYMRGDIDWAAVRAALPEAAERAEYEARLLELGLENAGHVRGLIDESLAKAERWVLVGGPPCQAYSLVGRARNNRNKAYAPRREKLEVLYLEYLQILADHAPPVFVMENVKGLLSAERDSQRLFDRIREDLRAPAAAIQREGRPRPRLKPRYEIFGLTTRRDLFGDSPRDYVVRSEEFGIPQKRHRVILLGIRSDALLGEVPSLAQLPSQCSVESAIGGLPRLRSGISKGADSPAAWKETLRQVRLRRWLGECDWKTRAEIRVAIERLAVPRADRGADVLEANGDPPILNHASRSHMVQDLERYMFASSFAQAHGRSPVLHEFPRQLLPDHANVDRKDAKSAVFADRFRVQVAGEPATTVTSHISKDGHYYIHPDPRQCRSLTVREAASLQTFPDDYFFCGPRTAQYQQVGNAVPPKLATRIAGVVAEVLGS